MQHTLNSSLRNIYVNFILSSSKMYNLIFVLMLLCLDPCDLQYTKTICRIRNIPAVENFNLKRVMSL